MTKTAHYSMVFATLLSILALPYLGNASALPISIGLDTSVISQGTIDLMGMDWYENTEPQAEDDSAQTDMDTETTIDVLANDSDDDGDDLFVSAIVEFPENGDVVINDDSTITYTPFEGFEGTDSFQYEVSDGNGGTATATVTVDVGAPDTNTAPVAEDDYAQTEIDTETTVNVLANDYDDDGDSIYVSSIAEFPANGDVTINDDSTITYTPNEGFEGTDSFQYEVSDGNGGTATAIVTVEVFAP